MSVMDKNMLLIKHVFFIVVLNCDQCFVSWKMFSLGRGTGVLFSC